MHFWSYTSADFTQTLEDIEQHVPTFLIGVGASERIVNAIGIVLEGFVRLWNDDILRYFDGTRFFLVELWDDCQRINLYDSTEDVRLYPERNYICVVMSHHIARKCIRTLYLGTGQSMISHLGMSLEAIYLKNKIHD